MKESGQMFNVLYFDEHGRAKLYLGCNVSEQEAKKWQDSFNERYRKPYPNGKGFYASAQVIEKGEALKRFNLVASIF